MDQAKIAEGLSFIFNSIATKQEAESQALIKDAFQKQNKSNQHEKRL